MELVQVVADGYNDGLKVNPSSGAQTLSCAFPLHFTVQQKAAGTRQKTVPLTNIVLNSSNIYLARDAILAQMLPLQEF